MRRLLTAGTVALVGTLTFAPAALASAIAPEAGGSPNADNIHELYQLTLYVALVIFIVVEGLLVYAMIRFRARKGAVAAQIHGNTRLEIGWTVGAAVILVILAVITFVKLDAIRSPTNSPPSGLHLSDSQAVAYASAEQKLPPNGRSLNILVNGQQFVWRYTYPGGTSPTGLDRPYSYEEMVVPTDTTITIDVTSQDVVHSWWIPKLGGKLQAVPGYHNYGWFRISKPGIYRGQCAFICGRLHARMIATVRAVPPAQFEAWLAQRRAALKSAQQAAAATRTALNKQTGPQAVSP